MIDDAIHEELCNSFSCFHLTSIVKTRKFSFNSNKEGLCFLTFDQTYNGFQCKTTEIQCSTSIPINLYICKRKYSLRKKSF